MRNLFAIVCSRGVFLLVSSLLIATSISAQYVILKDDKGMPVPSMKVVLSHSKDKKKRDTALLTDGTGRALLPSSGYPYSISVSGIGFQRAKDTIGGRHDKVIWLEAKGLNLDEVVITGQYAQTNREDAVQQIEVIGRKKIEAMAAQNLRDVLTNQLQVRLSYDPIFGSALNMQGSSSYGASPKILIDGVPVVGKQNGNVDLSQINLNNIERVEIIKGPMSVSYGTDAIAGTVNLITKKTVKQKAEVSAGTYYETIGTYNVNARIGTHFGRHSLSFDGMRNFFGGWNPGEGASLFDFDPRLADTSRVYLWKPRLQYQGCLQYVYKWGKNNSINYKGNYFYELISSRGTPLPPYQEMAFDNYFHTYRKDNALFLKSHPGTDKNINVMLAYNAYKRIKNETSNNLTTLVETQNPDLQDTSKYSELNSRGNFATSSNASKINYQIGYDINVQYANSTQIEERKQEMGNYALYGSIEYKPVQVLTVRPGLRYGYNTRYTAPIVPSLNLMYEAGKDLRLRASYARGFRQPGLKELYFDFVDINHNIHGNEDLKAEHSNNYSASATYTLKANDVSYKASLSAFYNDVQDLITLAAVVGGAANEYHYVNAGNFRTKGAQCGIEVSADGLSAFAGAAATGTFNRLSEEADVPSFSYSPELNANLTYSFRKYGLSAAVFFKHTGRFITYLVNSNDEAVQAFMNGYSIADLTLSKTLFGKRLTVSAGCKNVLDVKNVTANQVSGGAHSGGGTSAAIGTGRNYFVRTVLNLSY